MYYTLLISYWSNHDDTTNGNTIHIIMILFNNNKQYGYILFDLKHTTLNATRVFIIIIISIIIITLITWYSRISLLICWDVQLHKHTSNNPKTWIIINIDHAS